MSLWNSCDHPSSLRSCDGLSHYNGSTWSHLNEDTSGALCLHDDEVVVRGFRQGHHGVSRGRGGKQQLIIDAKAHGLDSFRGEVAIARGSIHFTPSRGEHRGLYWVDDDQPQRLILPTSLLGPR